MPRDLPLGNGRLLVNFDRHYRLRDLYYPAVGQENQTLGHPFRWGVWADGRLIWSEEWQLRLRYDPDTLLTRATGEHAGLGLALTCQDCVDFYEDALIRRVSITNREARERRVRLFFHHDLRILGTEVGDTAYFDPEPGAVIHYKGARYFLASGCVEGRLPCQPDYFATGIKEFHGAEGTWRDAEDGELSQNPIAQGSVDSTIGFELSLPPMGEATIYYWICAGKSCGEVSARHRRLVAAGPERLIERTGRYWRAWVEGARRERREPLPPDLDDLYRRSLLVMATQCDAGGAILAATDSDVLQWGRDTYSYTWPRDGALTAAAFDAALHPEVAARFYDFCQRVVDNEGYFLHKFNPDGSLGSSWHPWFVDGARRLPIQEDQTALVLWGLWEHYRHSGDTEFARRLYETVVSRCTDFILGYRDRDSGLPLPSHDLWEERWGVHAWTIGTLYGGLEAARRFAAAFGDEERSGLCAEATGQLRGAVERLWLPDEGRFARSLYRVEGRLVADPTPDSSLFGLTLFGLLPAGDERLVATAEHISEALEVKTAVGGLARYEGDPYQRRPGADGVPGNPWVICTLWRSRWLIARAASLNDLTKCLRDLRWARERATPSGLLAEQFDPYTGEPVSVCPLTWSHAEYVICVREYLQRHEELRLEDVFGDYYATPT